MGCCFSGEEEAQNSSSKSRQNPKSKPFTGAGNRLGTGEKTDTTSSYRLGVDGEKLANVTPIQINYNLDEGERERIRAERVAAAEKRVTANGGGEKKKVKKKDSGLKNPNSEPLMRWS